MSTQIRGLKQHVRFLKKEQRASRRRGYATSDAARSDDLYYGQKIAEAEAAIVWRRENGE